MGVSWIHLEVVGLSGNQGGPGQGSNNRLELEQSARTSSSSARARPSSNNRARTIEANPARTIEIEQSSSKIHTKNIQNIKTIQARTIELELEQLAQADV